MVSILRNMESACKKLTEDILLVIPLESSSTWNDPAEVSRIVTKLQSNLMKDDVGLVHDRVLRGADCKSCKSTPKVNKKIQAESTNDRKIHSAPSTLNSQVKIDVKKSENELTQTKLRKCTDIQEILIAQTQIAKHHQQTKRNDYENWPLNNNYENWPLKSKASKSTSDLKSESKPDESFGNESKSVSNLESMVGTISRANQKEWKLKRASEQNDVEIRSKCEENEQTEDNNSIKQTKGLFWTNIRGIFSTKPKIVSTFYVNLNENLG